MCRGGYYFVNDYGMQTSILIGTYGAEYEAAIAYNKVADMLEPVFPVNYTRNYIEDISHITYAAAYNSVKISKRVIEYVKRLAEKVK